MQDFQINDFGEWFVKNSTGLNYINYDKSLLKELDDIISKWDCGWEIGPGITKENSFTISPNGNKNLLNETREIINKAPILVDWEFYSSKQAKENWNKVILIETEFECEASDWSYVLLKYPDDKIEILLKADNLKKLKTDAKELVVDLVLTNLLGEKRKIEEIDFIDIVNEFESKQGITALKFLPDHLYKMKVGL